MPAPKGASTHIEAFVRGLAAEFGLIDLVTVSANPAPQGPIARWSGVQHWELPAIGISLIERVMHFSGFLNSWLEGREFDVIHFRSPFEGLPILKRRKNASLIFEVNGLPSIELRYRYPGSEDDRDLMRKLEAQDRACISAADLIVTPSAVTRGFLVNCRGASERKVVVIPNGVALDVFLPSAAPSDDPYKLLYFGTLSAWQGVEIAIRAAAQIDRATLTILGTGSDARRNALAQLAAKLGAADRISIQPSVSQIELAGAISRCNVVVAPLLWNDRNVVQGCCPLKILEGMAAARPVIASDLQVVRELGAHEEHLLLTEAGSVDSLVAAIKRLRDDPALAATVATNARRLIEERYTWTHSVQSLVGHYRGVISRRAARGHLSTAPVPVQN